MPQKIHIYIDGKFISVGQCIVDALAPGKFQARGIFETLRCDGHYIDAIDEHLKRLSQGLKTLKIKSPLTNKQWIDISQRLVKRNNFKIARLRWMVWKENKTVHYAVIILSYVPPTQKQYKNGIKVCLLKTKRLANKRLAYVKSLDYALFANASYQARSQGFDDVLLINQKGFIFESSKANIFVIINDHILTPPLSSGCLSGIARAQFIKLNQHIQMPIKEQNITPGMLQQASAIFLTNSLLGIIAVNLKDSNLKYFNNIS